MWNEKMRQRAMRAIITYGGPHRAWLLKGGLATAGVVIFRLAMPWPLRGVVEAVFPRGAGGRLLTDHLPAWGEPVLWLALMYLVLAVGLGVSEMIQRVEIMRFASLTVQDMRSAAARGVLGMPAHQRGATGEVITRIVGDSARLKSGISGIMVHGLQNGFLFLAVCGILTYISAQLGLIFLAAGLAAVYIGVRASKPVARISSKQRGKEDDYASVLHEGLDYGGLELEEINASSTKKEVRTTRIIARSSLYVHAVLAAAVGLGLWYGASGVKAGSVAPGDLFLFIAYALTVHRRMVQVGRQVARTGKVMASADRIASFIQAEEACPVSALLASVPLRSGLRLEGVKLDAGRGREGRARLKRTDLLIRPDTRVAVLGGVGAGKSSLLRVLAGVEPPDKGKIFWDDAELTDEEEPLYSRVAYLPQDPVFPFSHLWRLLGLGGPGALTPEQEEVLERAGVLKLLRSFPAGLEGKVGSTGVSRTEARLLRLAGILIGDTPNLWVLDNPVQGLKRSKARECLEEILRLASRKTAVIALTEQIGLERFDRVIVMRNGKIDFDGTPSEWEERKEAVVRVP